MSPQRNLYPTRKTKSVVTSYKKKKPTSKLGISTTHRTRLHRPRHKSPEEDVPKDGKKIIDRFIWRHPPPLSTDRVGSARLSLPVILPQKRPKDRQRGFIKAYAPILEEVGVDQATFLDFLETFNQASQASPWMNALNLAGLATLAMPHVIGTVVGIAITMAVKQAMEMQSRSRSVCHIFTRSYEFEYHLTTVLTTRRDKQDQFLPRPH